MENITDIATEYPNIRKDGTIILNDSLSILECVIKEDGNISGIRSDNGNKALFVVDENKWYYGKDIKNRNLINLSSRTKEERQRIGSIGGRKAQENRETKKTLNEIAKIMLDRALTTNQAKRLLNTDTLPEYMENDEISVGALLIAKGIQESLENGSYKWAELVRDTAGYKPKNEVDISADITTEADRSLLDKVSKRLNIG